MPRLCLVASSLPLPQHLIVDGKPVETNVLEAALPLDRHMGRHDTPLYRKVVFQLGRGRELSTRS